ncbi:MAG: transketolase [Verrucomicrobiota bacterium]|jgi:transketolase|nr:transketolase [Verrucomicrobiota bacterium]
MALDTKILSQAATDARGLAMDAVQAAASGHLGLPLGAAEVGAVLFGQALSYYPEDPTWINRDRFVLSAGHGSMFLYGWLHLAGYDVSIEDIKNFRQLHSKTPGHPEFGDTPGVEATTGPLGQGVGNAVGMAVASKMAEARFNTKEHAIFNHKIVCLAGDGCLQEGIASEAAAFGGFQKLDNLILIYDSNDVTLDAMAKMSQSEDTAERFRAYGYDVHTVNGNDLEAFYDTFEAAKHATTGKPQFIISRTLIGKGIPEVAGTQKAHGEAGVKFVDADRKNLGLPAEKFYVSKEVYEYFAGHREVLKKSYLEWQEKYSAWKKANSDLATLLEHGIHHEVPKDLSSRIPAFPQDSKIATRKAGSDVLQPVAEALPLVIGGSADLYGSTLNYINSDKDFNPENRAGRNIRFGIREHGMCAIMNGIAYHGIFKPSGATFLVFADYCRPSIRLASLAKLPVVYIFTHDSVGVGEDGPTHQPVETVSGLRVIPNLDVIRPGDPEETAGAFVAAFSRTDGPTLIALTRQAIPIQNEVPVEVRREGVQKGAYVARKETGKLETILLATGSELQHAFNAAKQLGDGVRVVSVPCTERFLRQDQSYQDEVLPPSCRKRVAIEAGVTVLWHRFVGLDGKVVGIDRFGMSGPGGKVMTELGMTAEKLVEAVKSLAA